MGKIIKREGDFYVCKKKGSAVKLLLGEWYVMGDGSMNDGKAKYPYFIFKLDDVHNSGNLGEYTMVASCVYEVDGTILNDPQTCYPVQASRQLLETFEPTTMSSVLDIMLYKTDKLKSHGKDY